MRLILFCSLCLSASAQNLFINGGFEVSPRHGWVWGASDAHADTLDYHWSQTEKKDGDSSLAVEHLAHPYWDKTSTVYSSYINSWPVLLKTNTEYTASVWLRNHTGSVNNKISFTMIDLANDSYDGSEVTLTATNTWERKTLTFNTGAGTWFMLKLGSTAFNTNQNATTWYYDSFQLEEGGSATDYAPSENLLLGLGINTTNAGNLFFDTETPTIPVRVFNATAGSLTNSVRFEINDVFNVSRQTNIWSDVVWPSGSTDTQINVTLPTDKRGWFQLNAVLYGRTNQYDSVNFTVIAPTNALANRTNGQFGAIIKATPYFLTMARKLGYTWNRMLSGAAIAKVSNPIDFYLTVTNTGSPYTFDWDWDAVITNNLAADIEPIMCLGNNSNDVSGWAKDADGHIALTNWIPYVSNVIKHYLPLGAKYYSVFNEPSGTEGGFYGGFEGRYVELATNAITVAASIDSGVKVIGPEMQAWVAYYPSAGTNAVWASNVFLVNWDLSGPMFDTITYHQYPNDSAAENFRGRNGIYKIMRDDVGWTGEVWNTECGPVGQPASVRWNQEPMAEASWFTGAGRWMEIGMELTLTYSRYAASNVANKIFQYDMRPNNGHRQLITWTKWDIDYTPKPQLAVESWAINCLEGATFVSSRYLDPFGITSTAKPAAEVHIYEKNDVTMALFAASHKTNTYSVGISSETTTFYDQFGNTLTGTNQVWTWQKPVWLFDSVLTPAEVAAQIVLATNSTPDSLAPVTRLEIYPANGTSEGAFRFRWTARDDVGTMTYGAAASTNDIEFAWYLSPGESDYGDYSTTNWADYTLTEALAASGTLYIRAKDPIGNVSESEYSWPLTEPADPGEAGESTTGTLRVGTLMLR